VDSSRFFATTEITMVGLFLATIFGLVSLDLAVKARIAFHEFHFLSFGVLLSSAIDGVNICGDSSIDVHMVSFLRGGALSIVALPPIAVSSLVVILSIGLFRGVFECLEESLAFLGELGCHLPLEVGFAGLFFPLFKGPRGFSSRVEVGGINDGAGQPFVHSMFEGFNDSLVG